MDAAVSLIEGSTRGNCRYVLFVILGVAAASNEDGQVSGVRVVGRLIEGRTRKNYRYPGVRYRES